MLAGREATLTDNNADLIACYRAVRDSAEQVIGELSRLANGHERNGADHYYEVRNARFNPQRAALAAGGNDEFQYCPELAAMFIYLNRTGYNGLFRLNSRGDFNVPAGRYTRPRICNTEHVRRVAGAFALPGVTLDRARFDDVIERADASDFVYLDPPYAPLSKTAHFTSYTAEGFDAADQERLRDIVVALARRGCHVVMSNSTAPEIGRLYEENPDVQAAGLKCYRIPARRAINSKGGLRGVIDEYVITNVSRR